MNISMKAELAEKRISIALGFKIYDFCSYHDGFSFFVENELLAYKAAYKYQGPHNRLVVKEAPNIGRWLVQLYENKKEMGE